MGCLDYLDLVKLRVREPRPNEYGWLSVEELVLTEYLTWRVRDFRLTEQSGVDGQRARGYLMW